MYETNRELEQRIESGPRSMIRDIDDRIARAKYARTQVRRARNQILRDMCGTSARAARADMGL